MQQPVAPAAAPVNTPEPELAAPQTPPDAISSVNDDFARPATDESPILQIHDRGDEKPDAVQPQGQTPPVQPEKPLNGAVEDPFYK
jgi:hypothetical protein